MKKVVSIMLCVVLLTVVMAGCAQTNADGDAATAAPEAGDTTEAATGATVEGTGEDRPFRVGISLQTLENPYWNGLAYHLTNIMTEKGWDFTIVSCEDSAAVQIGQIENFIAAGKDLILAHPADPFGLEAVAGQAREAGVLVMIWDDLMENSDLNWVLDNTLLGYEIGAATAEFINEHYSADNRAQVTIINYPATPVLLEREEGILQALYEIAEGNFDIVARQPALDTATAMAHIETIRQAHPDMRVVASIGGGGCTGANEAFMAATGGDIPADMGVFSADATEQQLIAIANEQATRVSVGFEGSSRRTAEAVVDLFDDLLNGRENPRDIVRMKTRIDINNVTDYIVDYQ